MRKYIFLLILIFTPVQAWSACTGSSPSWTCSSWSDLKNCIEGDHDTCSGFQDGDTITMDSDFTMTSPITISDPMTVDGGGSCNDRDETEDGCGEVKDPGGTWPVTVTGPGGSGDGNHGFIIAGSENDTIIVSGFQFTGQWNAGREAEDLGAVGVSVNNRTSLWQIHDCKWQAGYRGLALGLHGVHYGGLVYKISIQDTSTGDTYCIRLHDQQTTGHAASAVPSGGYTLSLFQNTPTWGGSQGTFIEDLSYNSVNDFHDNGSTIDASYGTRLTLRNSYFYNGWISAHGATDNYVVGILAYEVYDNTFTGNLSENWACALRSGSCLFHDNYVGTNFGSTGVFYIYDDHQRIEGTTSWKAPTAGYPWDGSGTSGDGANGYPFFGQVGWPQTTGNEWYNGGSPGSSTSTFQPLTSWPVYIWDNTGRTNMQESSSYVSLGTDYFFCTSDCVEGTDYPTGYETYTYPHPLRSGETPETPASISRATMSRSINSR
jgi:hypothetical protein